MISVCYVKFIYYDPYNKNEIRRIKYEKNCKFYVSIIANNVSNDDRHLCYE